MKTNKFLLAFVEILLDFLRQNFDRSAKVLDFQDPTNLKKSLAECLEIVDDPQRLEQLLNDSNQLLKYCVKTGALFNLYI